MAKQAGLLRAALVIGGTAAAAYFSKKENLDRVLDKVNQPKSPGSKPSLADKVKEKAVHERMQNQWPEWKKIHLSDYIICNDGVHPLIPQVQKAVEWMERS